MSYFNLTKTKNNLIGFIIQNNFYSFSQHRCNEYAPISNSIRFSSLKDPGAVFLSNCFQIKHLTPLVSKRLIKSSVFFFFFQSSRKHEQENNFWKSLRNVILQNKRRALRLAPYRKKSVELHWAEQPVFSHWLISSRSINQHESLCLIWIVTHWCVNYLRAPAQCSHVYNEASWLETAVFSQVGFGNWITFSYLHFLTL